MNMIQIKTQMIKPPIKLQKVIQLIKQLMTKKTLKTIKLPEKMKKKLT